MSLPPNQHQYFTKSVKPRVLLAAVWSSELTSKWGVRGSFMFMLSSKAPLVSHLICSLVDSQSTSDLWSTSSIHNTVVSDQIADYTKSIMESTLCLFNDLMIQMGRIISQQSPKSGAHHETSVDASLKYICSYHLVASTDENSYCPGVFAVLDNQHVILCCAKGDLLHQASCAELLRCQLRESWYNATSCGNGDQLHRKQL